MKMKRTKVKVKMQYTYLIEYECKEHLKNILKDLKEEPRNDVGGAGVASDGKVYGYRYRRIGNGKVIKNETK